MEKKNENIFRKLARWTVRGLLGLKFEEKWFGEPEKEEKEIQFKDGVPVDSVLIVSPGRPEGPSADAELHERSRGAAGQHQND